MRIATLSIILIFPANVMAAAGLSHAEHWVLRRDGAWIVNFAILFAGLFWITKRFILPALNARSEDLAKLLSDTETAREDAMKKLSELETKTRQFEKESEQIKKDAIAEGENIKHEILEEAKKQGERIIETARDEIEMETLKAQNLLKKEIVDMAVKVAKDILAENVSEGDQERILGEYMESVKGK